MEIFKGKPLEMECLDGSFQPRRLTVFCTPHFKKISMKSIVTVAAVIALAATTIAAPTPNNVILGIRSAPDGAWDPNKIETDGTRVTREVPRAWEPNKI